MAGLGGEPYVASRVAESFKIFVKLMLRDPNLHSAFKVPWKGKRTKYH